jgi:hypothetical protein
MNYPYDEKINSLIHYKGNGYGAINQTLRELSNSDESIEILSQGTSYTAKVLKNVLNIDRLFNVPKYNCSKNTILYRGVNRSDIDFVNRNEDAFLSCSTSIEQAGNFAGDSCCIIRFFLPDNIKSIQIDKTAAVSKDIEKEVLLERNTTWRDPVYISTYNKKRVYTVLLCKIIPPSADDLIRRNDLLEKERLIRQERTKYLLSLEDEDDDPFAD